MPELVPLLDEHMEDQEGEMLPHLLIADVARLLRSLEATYDHEPESVREMIHVSFLENLDADTWVWSRLGPVLSVAARLIHGNNPPHYPPGLRHG